MQDYDVSIAAVENLLRQECSPMVANHLIKMLRYLPGRMNVDRITLKSAMENPVWMMVYAADPDRRISVDMTYGEMFGIYKLLKGGNDNG